jgi:hypothetical protein
MAGAAGVIVINAVFAMKELTHAELAKVISDIVIIKYSSQDPIRQPVSD